MKQGQTNKREPPRVYQSRSWVWSENIVIMHGKRISKCVRVQETSWRSSSSHFQKKNIYICFVNMGIEFGW